MSVEAIVATVMFAVLIAFIGMVLWATFRQIGEESRRSAVEEER